MADPDIAIRLREADGGYFMRKMFTEAAEEIERLRAELDRIGLWMRITNAEIKRLRAERDEARREVCNMKDFHGLPRDYALERGWDCFKESDS